MGLEVPGRRGRVELVFEDELRGSLLFPDTEREQLASWVRAWAAESGVEIEQGWDRVRGEMMHGVEPDGEGAELVDLEAARRRLGGAYRIPCGKCGRPVHEHASRCPHCGVWFDGEAYEFSGPVTLRGRAWRRTRSAFWVLLVLVLLLVGLLALAVATAGAASPSGILVVLDA